MTEKNKRPGRPTQEKTASARCEFRVELKQKEHWQAYAEKQGVKSLSTWLKQLADKESGF